MPTHFCHDPVQHDVVPLRVRHGDLGEKHSFKMLFSFKKIVSTTIISHLVELDQMLFE